MSAEAVESRLGGKRGIWPHRQRRPTNNLDPPDSWERPRERERGTQRLKNKKKRRRRRRRYLFLHVKED